jgi:hypothetical protein
VPWVVVPGGLTAIVVETVVKIGGGLGGAMARVVVGTGRVINVDVVSSSNSQSPVCGLKYIFSGHEPRIDSPLLHQKK